MKLGLLPTPAPNGHSKAPALLSRKNTSTSPLFGSTNTSATPPSAKKLLEHLDFTAIGASPVRQIGVIFSSLIIWRLLAANERRRASVSKRWNELRENLMRDLLGFAFWFLGVPVLQRLYLGIVAKRNPKLENILIQSAKPKTAQGFFGWLKENNPINNRYIPSSQQVKDQMHQALLTLEKARIPKTHAAYQQTEAAYLRFIKHRNFATAIGLGSTILLLGVGINLLNFYLTRKNVARELGSPMPNATPIEQNPFAYPPQPSGIPTSIPARTMPSPFFRPAQYPPTQPYNGFPSTPPYVYRPLA